ncbi:uncharacterized protein MELLADRAFT_69769 [Melampsora larici-populina 98AG31]|uniref:Secreted protein n=1 Tax=Melampsora larici-populina (strain 98AG31 / pathotype 3-4-7) TaxID=747676 RepID=F4SC41_MELLP|nr:uncharacterized protein MELLADRAFT_69769 [Melampsora larici-populina 98AG31]EGF97793.1 hypothetical protein MELLADRAFT_69769 [Melampsora larici-populina 98AG31]
MISYRIMKQNFLLYTLVLSILQLELYQNGVQSMDLEIKEDYLLDIGRSSSESAELVHNQGIEISGVKSNDDFGKKEVQFQNKVQESDLDEFHNFWNQDDDYMPLKGSSSVMLQNLNNLLTSEKSHWAEKVLDLFKEVKVHKKGGMILPNLNHLLTSESFHWAEKVLNLFKEVKVNKRGGMEDIPEKLKLLHILNKLIRYCQVPLKAVQVVWFQLQRFECSGGSPSSKNFPFSWPVIFKNTLGLYEDKLISQIRSMDPRKDYVEFESMKSTFEDYGLQLTEDWLEEDQKKLFILWTSKFQLYSKIKDKPLLQEMIETQVIQTSLIEDVQTLSSSAGSYHDGPKGMAESCLKNHSRVLMDYMKCPEYSETSYLFISLVNQFKPYGLEIDPWSNTEDGTKILSFWATYINVFLKMKSLGETHSLQLVIDELVKEDIKETSLIMESFLLDQGEKEFNQNEPVLFEFLKYFSERSKSQSRQNLALKALGDFEKSIISGKT